MQPFPICPFTDVTQRMIASADIGCSRTEHSILVGAIVPDDRKYTAEDTLQIHLHDALAIAPFGDDITFVERVSGMVVQSPYLDLLQES